MPADVTATKTVQTNFNVNCKVKFNVWCEGAMPCVASPLEMVSLDRMLMSIQDIARVRRLP